MASVVLIGGTGQIGRAAATRLVQDGWDVTVLSRRGGLPVGVSEMGVRAVNIDRSIPGDLERALGSGVDVVVDVVAFGRRQALQLNALAGRIGSVIAISSASVYADDHERSLEAAEDIDSFPELPIPIPESQSTVAPSEQGYSGGKVAMEQALVDGPLSATIIRPGAIQGPGSALPRELYFVKRAMDHREIVVLVDNGESRFHTTSVENLAEMIRLAAVNPGNRILNCGDPSPPTVKTIGRTIGAAIDHQLEEVLLPETGYDRPDLSNPWAVPRPFVMDMSLAADLLSYRPATSYEDSVADTCRWLADEASRRDWSDTYLAKYFNYVSEDQVAASVGRR